MTRGKKFGLVFLVLSAGLVRLGFTGGNPLAGWLAISAGLAWGGVGLAYMFSWPGLLGKSQSGRLCVLSYLFFWPYHVLNYASLGIFRLSREAPFQEIVPGLYLGARLLPWEQVDISRVSPAAVLDLTCEFSEARFLRRGVAYACVPLLDGTAPTRTELKQGIDFIGQHLQTGPVYVHCALGHGRSATFVAGYLLASRKVARVAEAVAHVQSKRPGVRLRSEQLRALENIQA